MAKDREDFIPLERPEPQLVEEIQLPNGLKVEFYDCSRRVAGDRWYVGLLAKIPIEIREEDFQGFPDPEELCKEFLEQRGRVIHFEMRKERNFIDEKEKDEVFKTLLERQKAHTLSYIGHKEFARGVIKREIASFEERRRWWK